MNKKVRWITETAVMLAFLVALQALTKGFGQFVTGSCVNAVLAVTVLTAGLGSGIVVAVLSPVLAYLLGIAPQILVLPAIMVGNAVFVVLLRLIAGTDSRNENFTANERSKPQNIPTEMVVPERDSPGTVASA